MVTKDYEAGFLEGWKAGFRAGNTGDWSFARENCPEIIDEIVNGIDDLPPQTISKLRASLKKGPRQ